MIPCRQTGITSRSTPAGPVDCPWFNFKEENRTRIHSKMIWYYLIVIVTVAPRYRIVIRLKSSTIKLRHGFEYSLIFILLFGMIVSLNFFSSWKTKVSLRFFYEYLARIVHIALFCLETYAVVCHWEPGILTRYHWSLNLGSEGIPSFLVLTKTCWCSAHTTYKRQQKNWDIRNYCLDVRLDLAEESSNSCCNFSDNMVLNRSS